MQSRRTNVSGKPKLVVPRVVVGTATKITPKPSTHINDLFYFNSYIGNVKAEILCDSGATVSVINKQLFEQIFFSSPGEISKLEPCDSPVSSFMGKPYPILGNFTTSVEIGNYSFEHTFKIIDKCPVPCLFGIKFLREGKIDFPNKIFQINGKPLPIFTNYDSKSAKEHKIMLVGPCMINANHEKFVWGKIVSNDTIEFDKTFLYEPTSLRCNKNQTSKYNVTSARSLVVPNKHLKITVKLVNVSNSKVTLYKNQIIGRISEEHKITAGDFCNQVNMKSFEEQVPAVSTFSQITKTEEPIIPYGVSLEDSAFNDAQKASIRNDFANFSHIFSKNDLDFGQTDLVQHHINTQGSPPIKHAPYRLAQAFKEKENNEIKNMLEKDVIEPSQSPWASSVILVAKKCGSIRYCIDLRKVNNVTKKDTYPLPRIDETLDHLNGAKYFSSLDLTSGYWQIKLAPEDKEKTAFITQSGLYQFKVMPFGLCNAPATFQRLMELVLRGLQYDKCLVYLDDIIIFSKTFEEHQIISVRW